MTSGGVIMQQSNGGEQIPSHIAIILDGNGRWAKRRGLPCGRCCILRINTVGRMSGCG